MDFKLSEAMQPQAPPQGLEPWTSGLTDCGDTQKLSGKTHKSNRRAAAGAQTEMEMALKALAALPSAVREAVKDWASLPAGIQKAVLALLGSV